MKKFILFAMMMTMPLVACANPDYVSNDNKKQSPEKACDVVFEKAHACATIAWATAPAKSQDSKFTFTIQAIAGESLDKVLNADLEVILWMPSMGHGSSPTKVQKVNGTTYDVSDVYFIMGGDWEIRFVLKNGNDILDEAVYSLDI